MHLVNFAACIDHILVTNYTEQDHIHLKWLFNVLKKYDIKA